MAPKMEHLGSSTEPRESLEGCNPPSSYVKSNQQLGNLGETLMPPTLIKTRRFNKVSRKCDVGR